MASTTPLPTLLKSLNIGVASIDKIAGEDQASTSNTHAAPKLALTDQLHLLSAHIDTLEKSVQASVSSLEGKKTIQSQGERSIHVIEKIKQVQKRVERLEKQEKVKNIGNEVLECLAQYITAQEVLRKEKRLYQITNLLKDAVSAIEALEVRLHTGQLDADGLEKCILAANHRASLLGIRSANIDHNSITDEEDYRWIAQSGGAPPVAIRELGNRLEKAKDCVQEILIQGWKECIEMDSNESSMRIEIKDSTHVCKSTLTQLMETLEARSELKKLLEKFARDLVEQIFSSLMRSDSSWTLQEDSSERWQVIRVNGEVATIPNRTASALVQLLEYLSRRLFTTAPTSSQASFTISKIIVPSLVPALLRQLKESLPSKLERPITSQTIPKLENLSRIAREIYDTLLKNSFLQRDLQDEAEELLEWSENIRKNYMKSLGTLLRKRARNFLLKEAGGGWEAITIECEADNDLQKAVEEIVLSEKVEASLPTMVEDEIGDDAWSAWDADGAKSIETQQQQQQQQPRRTSFLSGKGRQKKSALGGRRVMKPADELGSGPLPESQNADDVSWGFDDDPSMGESSGRSVETAEPGKAHNDALDQEKDVDEDAWGLSEEEKVERAAKRASMRGDMTAAFQAYQASQEREKSNLGQIMDTENDQEDDDAWGLSAQEAEAGKSSGSGEKLSDTTTDPWEEIAEPAIISDVHSTPSASHGVDHSAWGWNDDEISEDKGQVSEKTAEVGQATRSLTAAESTPLSSSTIKSAPPIVERALSSPKERDLSPTSSISMISVSPLPHQTTLRPTSSASAKAVSPHGQEALSPVPLPLPPSSPKEKCLISQRSVSLVELITAVLDDVEVVLQEDDMGTLDISFLVTALNDILDMHRALLPVGHADTLANVPSLAMQFFNDCNYIGKELKELQTRWDSIQTQNKGQQKLDLEAQAQLTIALGKRSFDGQMLLQHKMLLDCLVDAEGFTRTYENNRFQACQRSIKQVELVLKQLQSAWKPVLTKSSYYSAMGRLVDGLLKRILFDIESIEDISEIESEKLANLLKTTSELEYLFRESTQPAEESIVALFVPSWFKASYLSEILTGSLVDIEFLYFEAGALVDYSKSEVTSLIRSLFADTPKRTRIIDRIQSS